MRRPHRRWARRRPVGERRADGHDVAARAESISTSDTAGPRRPPQRNVLRPQVGDGRLMALHGVRSIGRCRTSASGPIASAIIREQSSSIETTELTMIPPRPQPPREPGSTREPWPFVRGSTSRRRGRHTQMNGRNRNVPPNKPGPHEDAQHDGREGHQHPQPRVAPPGPFRGPRIAERRREVRFRERAAAQHVPRGRALSEHQQEPHAERDHHDERQHEQDVAGLHRSAYSGTCDRTMIRGSVISSIAYRRPSRPKPESFEPPYGI